MRHFPHLEILSIPAARVRKARAPLLFVHGGYCDAWCWQPHFMPWFAARGHACHAVSLRGHGASDGHETLFGASLDDYAADVLRAMRSVGDDAVLVGHSMGAAVIERIVESHALRAAALLAPLPPSGLLVVATRLLTERPDFFAQVARMQRGEVAGDALDTLRALYFTPDTGSAMLLEAARHLWPESSRALFDISLRLPALRHTHATPTFVLGAEGDRICTPDDVRAVGREHGAKVQVVEGLAHMLMLVPGWERAAEALAVFVDRPQSTLTPKAPRP